MPAQQFSNDDVIRPAAADEKPALEDLQMRASLALPEYRESLLARPDVVEVPIRQIERGHVLVACAGAAIAGFAALEICESGPAELDGLFVEPRRWGEGIGSRLLRAIEALAAANGAQSLDVIASPAAAAFYARNGFAAVGQAVTMFGPAVAMNKAIAGASPLQTLRERARDR